MTDKAQITNPFARKIVGTRKRREETFTDEKTGIAATIRELYTGDELELTHGVYRLKPGVDFADIEKARRTGGAFKLSDFMELNLAKNKIARLARMIARWNVTDEAGADLPITEASIEQLPRELYDLLVGWADSMSDEKKEAGEVKN